MNKLLFGESYTPEELTDYQIKVIDKLEFHVNYALSFNSSPENNDHIRSWLIEAQRELPMHKEQLVDYYDAIKDLTILESNNLQAWKNLHTNGCVLVEFIKYVHSEQVWECKFVWNLLKFKEDIPIYNA